MDDAKDPADGHRKSCKQSERLGVVTRCRVEHDLLVDEMCHHEPRSERDAPRQLFRCRRERVCLPSFFPLRRSVFIVAVKFRAVRAEKKKESILVSTLIDLSEKQRGKERTHKEKEKR